MIDIDSSISEHGENPWRTRRCNRGTKSAKGLVSPATNGDNSAGKVAYSGETRKPEDLFESYIERNSMVKGFRFTGKVCQSPFSLG